MTVLPLKSNVWISACNNFPSFTLLTLIIEAVDCIPIEIKCVKLNLQKLSFLLINNINHWSSRLLYHWNQVTYTSKSHSLYSIYRYNNMYLAFSLDFLLDPFMQASQKHGCHKEECMYIITFSILKFVFQIQSVTLKRKWRKPFKCLRMSYT